VATAFLGLDVGNTRLSAALVSRDGRVLALRRGEAPPTADEAVEALVRLTQELMGQADTALEAAGIGFGGPVDTRSGEVRGSFLSSGWEGLPLGRLMAERLGMATWLANDADAGGLGEARFGAGRGASSLLYVNVGTGIGGAVLLDGRLHVGATSSAGEIGHMVLSPDGPVCECGKRGCLQVLASGTAIARRARERLHREMTGREVGEAALAGDPQALEVIDEAAWWLGLALANAAQLLDPERIVIGGGVAELGEVFLAPVRASHCTHTLGPAAQTPIVPAELGYDAGVIGAAAVAMEGAGARSDP